MHVASQGIVLPSTHQRRQFLPTTRTFETSPIGVSNKIKAIQARKTRLNPITNDVDYTNIRPLNFGYTNSKEKITVWTAEKLCDRSKECRLDRIPTRQLPAHRPSIYPTTNTVNHQTLLWPNYPTSTTVNKQLQTPTITPPSHTSIKDKPAGGKMPEIPRRRTRPILTNRPILPLTERTYVHPQTVDKDDDELVMDREFEEYLEKAIVKCADWLLKHVFIDENK